MDDWSNQGRFCSVPVSKNWTEITPGNSTKSRLLGLDSDSYLKNLFLRGLRKFYFHLEGVGYT